MNFLNLGIGEVLLILIIALILFGPGNMVKTARDIGTFLRKVVKSPYWQEVWATKRELSELPRIISKEAHLDETLSELDKESKGIQSKLSTSVKDFIREVDETYPPDTSANQPQIDLDKAEKDLEKKNTIHDPVNKKNS